MLSSIIIEVTMLGLWFAIAGMISGAICSIIAKQKNRTQKNWYMLGQIFPVLSIIVLLFMEVLTIQAIDTNR